MGYGLLGRGLLLVLLVGCAGEKHSPQSPEKNVPDRSAEIVVGLMTRDTVREHFGPPVLASGYWRFDLFRTGTVQASTLIAITPWPIPFVRFKDQIQRYTLVAYDPEGRASEVVSGLYRRPTDWRSASPIEYDFPALHLRTGDLLFFIVPDGERRENLLAAPALRDDYLARTGHSQECTLVLGCGEHGCPDQLALDGQPPQRLPLRLVDPYWYREGEREAWLRGMLPPPGEAAPPWLDTLVALRLPAGEHRLEFTAGYLDGRHLLGLACRAGELSYLQVTAMAKPGLMREKLVGWLVEPSQTMPAAFRRRPLVLMVDGRWYVEERR